MNDRTVSQETLQELLLQGGESPELDFKETLDLTDRHDELELTKDVAAMLARGGNIVVGAKNDGTPSGRFTRALAEFLDEARLRPKFAKYLAEPFTIRTATHEVEGNVFTVIRVEPSPHGIAVIEQIGEYKDGAKGQRRLFVPGDVFVRHGTSSERWTQQDVLALIQRLIAMNKEAWLAEHREDLRRLLAGIPGLALARGPAKTLDWALDEETFEAIVVEQIRVADRLPLELLLDRLPDDSDRLWTSSADSSQEDFRTLLDRLSAIIGLGIRSRKNDLVSDGIRTLVTIYDRVHLRKDQLQEIGRARILLDIVLRVLALGALAVRKKDWRSVNELARQRPEEVRQQDYFSWIRHAGVMAARAGLAGSPGNNPGTPMVAQALDLARRVPCLRPDVASTDEGLLTSLLQFEFLACCMALSGGDEEPRYSCTLNFAFWHSWRVEPAALNLIEDPAIRAVLFPVDNPTLARVLSALDQAATKVAFAVNGWYGWRDSSVTHFLKTHELASGLQ